MHTSTRRGISTPFVILLSLYPLSVAAILHAQTPAQPHAPAKPAAAPSRVQSASNAGTVSGTVTDPSGAVIANATVTLANAISGFSRTVSTDNSGAYTFANIPFNTYRLAIAAPTMAPAAQSVDVRSFVPLDLPTTLQIASASTVVEVTASSGDLIEADPVSHTDIDRELFDKIPLAGSSATVSQLVTLASPGVSADSNGMFHGMGDHASNSFSVDGQSITDQTSKTFSNQIPMDSVQSLEVIPGAPPAEYGGKTSLVIVATTRSGLGNPTPHGDVNASYGSFGSANVGVNLAYGSQKAGNFISASVMNTGRFLDPPEFHAIHE